MLQAIYKWLINLFHIHTWGDEYDGDLINSRGHVGKFFVQKCSTCGKRRKQIISL